ncbi:hypothetical protein ACG873_19390 [Mesorhizobium sp. AaZ16]|uniref:hypothetical protein n=1 Tax=Mesorhizobium sp. AaZ16 TaxID=3402289 RepID=UPI00374F1299
MSVILANLYFSHVRDENRYVAIDRSNDGYPHGIYNPLNLNIRATRDSINYLIDANPSYVEVRGGNFDQERGVGYTTRFRASERLIGELEDSLFREEHVEELATRGIIRNTLNNNPNNLALAELFQNHNLPLVRLRGEAAAQGQGREFIHFEQTDETRRMEGNLRRFNQFIADHHWLDLLIPDQEFQALSRRNEDERDEFGDIKDHRSDLDLLFRNQLYRVFNNGRFNEGGRFYGGWWQGVPSHLRRYLTINWYPTAELDYSNMQIAMLYADQRLALEGDAYSIEGIPATHRKLIKRTVLKIINAPGQIRAPRRVELPEGWTWRQIIDAVREKHAPIARYFGTGEGIRLQKRDADIAETVMLRLMDENILALPIHDSFIVEDGRQNRLRQVMVESYHQHLGQDIPVDADETWVETLPADAPLLDELGVRDLEDWLSETEQGPEYANYRQRRRSFLQLKGEAWGHEHHFHS